MKILQFGGYDVGAPSVYLPLERIMSFRMIDFNGRYGTEISLPEGRYIRVLESPDVVKRMIEAAVLDAYNND
jgi:hypothetical protein